MFFAFGIKDFIDILLVALLLYYTYKLMKASGSLNVFIGILVFILIWLVVSQVLEMKLLGSIFDKLVSVGVLALIILFQEREQQCQFFQCILVFNLCIVVGNHLNFALAQFVSHVFKGIRNFLDCVID